MLEEKNVIGFQGSRMPLSIARWWGFWSWLQTNQRRFFFFQYNKDGPYQEWPLLVPYHFKSESPPLTCL
jgi:hypothetical protein